MKYVLIVALIVGTLFLIPAICMWLWNWLCPEIFGLQTITYVQAMGLMALSSCFFYRGSSSGKK